jgi:hypothetical protein
MGDSLGVRKEYSDFPLLSSLKPPIPLVLLLLPPTVSMDLGAAKRDHSTHAKLEAKGEGLLGLAHAGRV